MSDMDMAACEGMWGLFDEATPDARFGKPPGAVGRYAEAAALKVCAGCPVRVVCADRLWFDPWLVAGGVTARGRRAARERAYRDAARARRVAS